MAGVKGSPAYVAKRALIWSTNPKVKAAISAGKAELRRLQILTREESLSILAKIARSPKATNRDRCAALERAARMCGYDQPTRVEMKVEGSLLHQIRTATLKA